MKKVIKLSSQPVPVSSLFDIKSNQVIELLGCEGLQKLIASIYGDNNFSSVVLPVKLYSFTLLKANSNDVLDFTVEYEVINYINGRETVLFDGELSQLNPVYIPLCLYGVADSPLYFYFSNVPSAPNKAIVHVYSGKVVSGEMDYSKVKVLEVYTASGNTPDSTRFVLGYLGYDDVVKITTDSQNPLGLKIVVCN